MLFLSWIHFEVFPLFSSSFSSKQCLLLESTGKSWPQENGCYRPPPVSHIQVFFTDKSKTAFEFTRILHLHKAGMPQMFLDQIPDPTEVSSITMDISKIRPRS